MSGDQNEEAMSEDFPGGANGRRRFLRALGQGSLGAMVGGLFTGRVESRELEESSESWRQRTQRQIRVGVVGFGASGFAGSLGLADHPNVKVVAVSERQRERRRKLQEATRCPRAHDSLDALLSERKIEAIVIATGAPNHARDSIAALRAGKHVLCSGPAVFGSLEEAAELRLAAEESGQTYMMGEPNCFRSDCHAMRVIYRAGGLGKIIYGEGEIFDYSPLPPESDGDWRRAMPPLWNLSPAAAFFVGVTGKRLTSVSCLGKRGRFPEYKSGANEYENHHSDEIALFETDEGGVVRLLRARSIQGHIAQSGRLYGELGRMEGMGYHGALGEIPDISRPALPDEVVGGRYPEESAQVLHEFVQALLEKRAPLIDVHEALAMTVPGILAHRSALRDGERIRIPEMTVC